MRKQSQRDAGSRETLAAVTSILGFEKLFILNRENARATYSVTVICDCSLDSENLERFIAVICVQAKGSFEIDVVIPEATGATAEHINDLKAGMSEVFERFALLARVSLLVCPQFAESSFRARALGLKELAVIPILFRQHELNLYDEILVCHLNKHSLDYLSQMTFVEDRNCIVVSELVRGSEEESSIVRAVYLRGRKTKNLDFLNAATALSLQLIRRHSLPSFLSSQLNELSIELNQENEIEFLEFSAARNWKKLISSTDIPTKPIVIVRPQLNIPFKKPPGFGVLDYIRASEDVSDLRKNWFEFTEKLRGFLQSQGLSINLVEMPFWQITPSLECIIDPAMLIVPHKTESQFPLRCPHFFYMQVIFPWLFSVDEKGWSAASSKYPCGEYENEPDDLEFFGELANSLRGSNSSKFEQPERRSRGEMIAEGLIPNGPFIFFPCQIPHDESIRFFSDFSAESVVKSLSDWANEAGVYVVFKPHPANLKAMERYKEVATGSYTYWSDASIHDLIDYSSAVYLINSGVGFEALLYAKPIVTFGRVEYDAVTIHATPSNLNEVWEKVLSFSVESAEHRYAKFVSWYLKRYAFSLKHSDHLNQNFHLLAEKIKRTNLANN